MWPSKQKPALFTSNGILRNTVLKYSVTNTQPQLCIVPVCWAVILSYLLVFIVANLLYLWWLNFMVFLPSLSAVSIDNRGDGWDGWQDGVRWDRVGWEVAKTIVWDTLWAAMMPTHLGTPHEQPWCLHSGQWHNSGPHSQWERTQVPVPSWCPPWVPLFQPWLWRFLKMPFTKADQLTFNTRYTGDGWILSVSVNCGNKIEFSFGVNYAGFC